MQQLSSVLLGAPVSAQNAGQESRGDEGFADLLSHAQDQFQRDGGDRQADKPAGRSMATSSPEAHQQNESVKAPGEPKTAGNAALKTSGKGDSKGMDEAELEPELKPESQHSQSTAEGGSDASVDSSGDANAQSLLIPVDITNEQDSPALDLLFSQIQLARQWVGKGGGADLPPEGEVFAALDINGDAFTAVNMWFSVDGQVSTGDAVNGQLDLAAELESLLTLIQDMPGAQKLAGILGEVSAGKTPVTDIEAMLSQLTTADAQLDLQKLGELLGTAPQSLSDAQQKTLNNVFAQLTALVQVARLEGQNDMPGSTAIAGESLTDAAEQTATSAVKASGVPAASEVKLSLSATSNQQVKVSALPEGIVSLTPELEAEGEQVSLSQAAKMLQQSELTLLNAADVADTPDERVAQLAHNQNGQTPIHRSEAPQFQLSVRQEIDGQAQQQQLIQKFAPLMQQQLVHMVSKGIGQAEIRLDPPELGKMLVRIQVNGEQTQVQFHA
ncbi:MAG: flagellar hook-length control protein FliK, partial [Shewanella sp.]|nr:flagellar hook-length control protein FliK [Shewanella sp.]